METNNSFNPEYRFFAKEAKHAGFSSQERKAFARNPEQLIAIADFNAAEVLSPKNIVSFLKLLSAADSSVEETDILEIGSFLYKFRPGEENESYVPSPEDRRIFEVAVRLLEKSFYAGKLEMVSKEQAATLAFVSNMFAKLTESGFGEFDPDFEWGENETVEYAPPAILSDREKRVNFFNEVQEFRRQIIVEQIAQELGSHEQWNSVRMAIQALQEHDKKELIAYLSDLQDTFEYSTNFLSRRKNKDSFFFYLVKSYLVTGEMIKDNLEYNQESTQAEIEEWLASGDNPYFNYSNEGESYDMSNQDGTGPGYAQVHFIPSDIPFMIWARRYLHEKNTKGI